MLETSEDSFAPPPPLLPQEIIQISVVILYNYLI